MSKFKQQTRIRGIFKAQKLSKCKSCKFSTVVTFEQFKCCERSVEMEMFLIAGRAAAVDHGVKEKSHSYWIIGILLPCYAVDQRRKVAKVS
ncbi:hypothetical protein T10_7744 [Trichinella papuae]|uniref:Uncharacterized protein n=1 Tax=Trichinella papuae TaxID=268474 RepID=A0A0V1MLC7_9BILA|nr:hypothetical protein T10_7744 [Trichinella papuae]